MTEQIAEGAIPGGKAAFFYQRIEATRSTFKKILKKVLTRSSPLNYRERFNAQDKKSEAKLED